MARGLTRHVLLAALVAHAHTGVVRHTAHRRLPPGAPRVACRATLPAEGQRLRTAVPSPESSHDTGRASDGGRADGGDGSRRRRFASTLALLPVGVLLGAGSPAQRAAYAADSLPGSSVGPPVAYAAPPPAGRADLSAATLRWLTDDPDADEFSGVLATYNVAFVTYLARFLLNFDPPSSGWFATRCKSFANADADTVRELQLSTFASFAASVQYGLRGFEGREGVEQLFDTLVRIHGAYPERRRHLALAFTLLEAAQPRERIAGLLRAGDGTPTLDEQAPFGTAPFSPGLPDYLARDPRNLLPPTQVPVWDANLRRYVVRGLAQVKQLGSYAQEGYARAEGGGSSTRAGELSVFGPRAAFAVQRERRLTPRDFALFALSGAAGCCGTHATVTPLDVVKTRLQTAPGRYEGLVDGCRQIAREEGWRMLFCGIQPTIAGYTWYGMTVYPGYEFFSRYFDSLAGVRATDLHAPIVILSGACATVVACLGVCPAEAARIRIVAQPDFAPDGLVGTVRRISAEDGFWSLYDGFGPLIFRQVIFGMVKFYTFDSLTDTLFAAMPSLKALVSTQLLVSLIAGLAAGVASACVSQPADAILSEVNRQSGRGDIPAAVRKLWAAGGGTPARFFTGLGSRCVWSGSIISGQFFLYDIAKTLLGLSSDNLLLYLDVQFKNLQL